MARNSTPGAEGSSDTDYPFVYEYDYDYNSTGSTLVDESGDDVVSESTQYANSLETGSVSDERPVERSSDDETPFEASDPEERAQVKPRAKTAYKAHVSDDDDLSGYEASEDEPFEDDPGVSAL